MRRATLACLLIFAVLASAATAAAAVGDPLFGQQWGLTRVRAPEAWSTANGSGIVIAIVDSGVDLDHADLKTRLVAGRNFVEPGTPPRDDCGHGTHVAGIAAAATRNGVGISGVAPGARIMPVRVLESDGSGGCGGQDVSAAIRWAADHGARVINMSFGEDTQAIFGPSFSEAVRYAWSKGAIPVVAAGNEFLLSSGFGDEPALVVAATDRNDNKPLYSSGVGSAQWGISAPGGAGSMFGPSNSSNDILSTYFDPSKPGDHNMYATMAGTSMAAPFVSGAAAVLLSMGLSKDQVVQRLLSTADNIGSSGTFGHGRLNLERAVRSVAPRAGTTARPRATSQQGTSNQPAVRPPPTTSLGGGASPSSTSSNRPSASASVETPSSSPPGSYAAPESSSDERSRSPILPIAAAAAGLASLSLGAWTLRGYLRAKPR